MNNSRRRSNATAVLRIAVRVLVVGAVCWPGKTYCQVDTPLSDALTTVVRQAFVATHQGYSADEVVLDDDFFDSFLTRCRLELPEIDAWRFGWTLLNLRKAGKLSDVPTTQFRRDDTTRVQIVAEIAARTVQDRHDLTIDRILVDPLIRSDFNTAARQIDGDIDAYLARKAALQLRKTRRLQPELVTRIANWDRRVEVFALADVATDLSPIPHRAGIYIFRDATGYLYVGEADNLQRRLNQHSQKSDRLSLANYFEQVGLDNVSVEIHTFADGAPIERLSVRRAYESELIRSRNPRFNIRP